MFPIVFVLVIDVVNGAALSQGQNQGSVVATFVEGYQWDDGIAIIAEVNQVAVLCSRLDGGVFVGVGFVLLVGFVLGQGQAERKE